MVGHFLSILSKQNAILLYERLKQFIRKFWTLYFILPGDEAKDINLTICLLSQLTWSTCSPAIASGDILFITLTLCDIVWTHSIYNEYTHCVIHCM